MNDTIAQTHLMAVRPNGDRIPVTLAIGKPYQIAPDQEWACPVSLADLHKLPDARGEDSFQALCLAISLALRLLESFQAQGGRLLFAGETDEEYELPKGLLHLGLRPTAIEAHSEDELT
ncbi:MAG: hypothetical protein F6J87_03885 [Spirulina sp. SIO3F2]|nr:hypothetical protein [Spirulina sp. SIO3F2]